MTPPPDDVLNLLDDPYCRVRQERVTLSEKLEEGLPLNTAERIYLRELVLLDQATR